MPSRVIRGEINASRSLARVSLAADLTFRALLVAVDDYGRGEADPLMLKAALFPRRPDVTPELVRLWVDELAREGCVQLYRVKGEEYLCFPNWEKHRGKAKRGDSSRFPDPPADPGEFEIPADPRGSPREPEDSADPRSLGSGSVGGCVGGSVSVRADARQAPPARSRKEPIRAEKPNPGRSAVAAYCEEFQAARGAQAAVSPHDAKALKELVILNAIDDARVRLAAKVFFADEDPWLSRVSYSLRAFVDRFQQCDARAQVRAGRPAAAPAPEISPEARAAANCLFGGSQ